MNNASTSIWKNGALVDWADATTHVMSHALHYGSSVFEGIRSYDTPRGPVFFRLEEHVARLLHSARIYAMPVPYDREQLIAACHETVAANGLASAYVRPLIYRGEGSLGLDPHACTVEVVIAAIEWGLYHGASARTEGVDVRTASWQRPAPNTVPAMAKAGGNYLSGQLIASEARRDGYHEGLALDVDGYVSEGSGQNVFVVRDGVLFTPPDACSILPGLTRDTVMQLAQELGLEVRVERIVRELLLIADEVFFTGTATEITPVRSIDRQPVGAGRRGPITEQLQQAFADVIRGAREDPRGYVTPLRGQEVRA